MCGEEPAAGGRHSLLRQVVTPHKEARRRSDAPRRSHTPATTQPTLTGDERPPGIPATYGGPRSLSVGRNPGQARELQKPPGRGPSAPATARGEERGRRGRAGELRRNDGERERVARGYVGKAPSSGVRSPSPMAMYNIIADTCGECGQAESVRKKQWLVQGLVATEGRRNVRRGCHQAGTIHSHGEGRMGSARAGHGFS